MKKTLAIILAILMVVTMLPMAVLPAGAMSKTQDGFIVHVTYGVCKYCGDKHGIDYVDIKAISVENGKVTFQLSVGFKSRGDCSKPVNVKAYTGVSSSYITFAYTITDDFSCEQSYLINESYGQNFGEDKPKLLYSISREEGHQASSWTFNGTKHSGTCELCGKKVNDNCSGGTATCMEKATCSTCGNKYGSLASDNHDWSNLDGICANGCGAECSHKWGDGALVRPTKTEEGYYTYTCSACGATKTEVAERAANYAEYTKALNDLRAYLDSDKLTDDVKASVVEWLEIYDSDEAYKFIAGEEETVNLYIEAALYYAAEIEAAIQDCLAGNHSGNGEYCDICGAALHICDFSGEWQYDSEKHWKECSCGVSDTVSTHTYIDGACECGYECAHKWGDGALVRPTRTEEGYLLYTCSICKDTKIEPVERPDNYSEFKELLEKVKGYLDENLTDSMLQEVNNVINFFELDANHRFIKGEENTVSQIIRQISGFVEVVEEGIADGTALKADYTEIDEAIAALDEKLADVNLTDEAKTELEEIKAELEEMKADGNTSEADLAALEKALEEYETELDAGIEDGTIVLVDVYKILEEYDIARSDDLEEKYGKEKVDVVFLKIHRKNPGVINSIWEYADSITGTVAETADEIEELKRKMDALYAAIERCIIGTHNVEEYEVVSPAKCEANAIESGTCTLCCDVITREVENSALTHSFTKYEVTEEAKCGVEGKEVAACDNGCGATDEKAIEALTHSFTEYVYNEDATCTADGTKTAECANGCGETDTVIAEDTMLNHADEDGDNICDDCQAEIKDVCPDCGGAVHDETGVSQYICMLVTFIRLIASLIKAFQ